MSKTSIIAVADSVAWEARNYKEQYDKIKKEKEQELKIINDTYKPGTKIFFNKIAEIEKEYDLQLAELKIQAANRAHKDIEELRQQELERIQVVDQPLLAKIQAVQNIPMTTSELSVLVKKLNNKGDYWANRMLADTAELWGINASEIGIESTYDTKMEVLDGLEAQLDKILRFYGTKDIEWRTKVNYAYLSNSVVENAIRMYDGKISRKTDEEIASKAYVMIKASVTDIQRGIAISNALRNASAGVKNELLCKLAREDISDMAAEISGHEEEIESFRNGKAKEFLDAKKALQNICKIKDAAVIEKMAAGMEENTFFGDMYAKEQKTNIALYETLHGEQQHDNSETE